MISLIKDKPTMVIAGPGAGKTYDMVNKVADAVPRLEPNRILAAITFTNAATESIRERLQKVIQISPNVFVGTTYSFFSQFIFLPFASLFDYVALDKLFLEVDVGEMVKKVLGRNPHPAACSKVRKKITDKLLREGKVPLNQIASVSAKLMDDPRVREVVGSRIQFLFEDEFQDIDTVQFRIIDAIRKGKNTTMYCVGDPEQYILGFTYNVRSVKKPSFKNIPINRFASDCDECKKVVNRRACEPLVEFTNNFHTSVTQVSEVDPLDAAGVFFVADTDLDVVITDFIKLTQSTIRSCENGRRLFLGHENKTFRGFAEKYGLVPVSNEHSHPKSILSESLELISSAVQLSSKSIRDEYELDAIGHRKLGIRLLRTVSLGNVRNAGELTSFLKDILGLQCQNGTVSLDAKLEKLKTLLGDEISVSGKNFYSSIHKAKGLEADCVLVVSKNRKELKKWLETDYKKRCEDKTDTCRIGYVGFTRAKQILCIACKEPIDEQIECKLLGLKVKVVH